MWQIICTFVFGMNNFEALRHRISQELQQLNELIANVLRSDSELLQSVIDDYMRAKGKQIRPILTILTAKALGEANDRTLNGAAAVELLHNASLIHDDVVDESPMRRGYPTVNHIWDNHIAVLAGDFFVSRALACAAATGDIRILKEMAAMGTELSQGEMFQIDNAINHLPSRDRYMNAIRRKTASLFRCCVLTGGFSVDAPQAQLDRLASFAEKLGLCFQIRDDIFDYFDSTEIGKPTGSDLKEGKVTLPLICALENADAAEREAMTAILAKTALLPDSDVATLVAFAKEHGGIDAAYATMDDIRSEAFAYLESLPQSQWLDALRDIFNYIIDRRN